MADRPCCRSGGLGDGDPRMAVGEEAFSMDRWLMKLPGARLSPAAATPPRTGAPRRWCRGRSGGAPRVRPQRREARDAAVGEQVGEAPGRDRRPAGTSAGSRAGRLTVGVANAEGRASWRERRGRPTVGVANAEKARPAWPGNAGAGRRCRPAGRGTACSVLSVDVGSRTGADPPGGRPGHCSDRGDPAHDGHDREVAVVVGGYPSGGGVIA